MDATSPVVTAPPADDAPGEDILTIPVPLPVLRAGERSLPVRPGDLTRLLAAEPGLAPSERERLGRFARMLGSVFHYQFADWLTELKELYAPIDPDSDCVGLPGFSTARTEQADERFFGPFEAALVRANYRPLDLPTLEQAIATPNDLGLDYEPDLSLFEHLRVYVRGHGRVVRTVRNERTLFRRRTVAYDAYRRLVVALKFREGAELDEYVRHDVVYLRMFKDVPYVDMDMHLPEHGTRVRMRWLDKLMIASPVATGLPMFAFKLFMASAISPIAMAGVLAAPVSAGLKSFFGFQQAKKKYLHYMIRHLYYLTLANNASVINRLIDSAEEEEYKEALLAYYFLWRGLDDPEPWTSGKLDRRVESYLREKTGLELDFEVGDALEKLTRLAILSRDARGGLRAVPLDRALAILDDQWIHHHRPLGTDLEPHVNHDEP